MIVFVNEIMHGGTGELRAAERVSMRAKQKTKLNEIMIFWRLIS